MKSRPVTLVQDGVVLGDQLAAHQLSRDDLMEGLRMEQVDDPGTLKIATLEGGGKISVVKKHG